MSKELIIKDIAAFRVAQGFVSKDEHRWPLRGVLIEPNGTIVATDGKILFIGRGMIDASSLKEEIIIETEKTLHKYSSTATIDMEIQHIITDKGSVPFKIIKEPYVKYKGAVPSGELLEINSIGLTTSVMVKAMVALDSLKARGGFVALKFGFRGVSTGVEVSLDYRDDIQVIIMPCRL